MVQALSFEVNKTFVLHCLQVFWGETWPHLLIFVLGLIWICLSERKKGSMLLVWSTLFLVVTIYNPVVVSKMIPRLTDRTTYYRLFWALPVLPGAAYAVAAVIARLPKKNFRILAGIAVFVFLGLTASVNWTFRSNFQLPQNLEKVPNALVYACQVIHEDYQEEQEQTGRLPKAIFTDWLEVYARQYDPSIRLTINRNTRLIYNGSQVVGATKDNISYKRRARILNVINSAADERMDLFQTALDKTATDYLIIPADFSCHEYLKEAGLRVISDENNLVIYRWDRDKTAEEDEDDGE